MPDPRVFYAAERTLLAWVRTSLTMMALGFVVARFGVVASLISGKKPAGNGMYQLDWVADGLGGALVLLGSVLVAGAWVNHRAYVRSLSAVDLPELALPWLSPLLAAVVALLGVLMTVYLLCS